VSSLLSISSIELRFAFEEETLTYIDAPYKGWMRDRETGERYEFECNNIVRDLLWHWILLPASQEEISFVDSRTLPMSGHWISIIEDRRRNREGDLTVAIIEFSKSKPWDPPSRRKNKIT
jgi:hypothetical protein